MTLKPPNWMELEDTDVRCSACGATAPTPDLHEHEPDCEHGQTLVTDGGQSPKGVEQRRCPECGWQDTDSERGGSGPPYCSECGVEFPPRAGKRYLLTGTERGGEGT